MDEKYHLDAAADEEENRDGKERKRSGEREEQQKIPCSLFIFSHIVRKRLFHSIFSLPGFDYFN